LPGSNGTQENFAAAVTEVSERVTVLIRDEVELAKAEVTQKVSSLARGTVAVLLGAVFGVFALIFLLETAAWGLNAILIDGAGDLWIGFAIVFGVLALLTIVVFLFAWRKLRVGPPTPQMAIDEAKLIKDTVPKMYPPGIFGQVWDALDAAAG
jgi:hypothetical protein